MSEALGLGKIITTPQQRDAIHVAVAPVVANSDLKPGQRVGFVREGSNLVGPGVEAIGIVDPFLSTGPRKNQEFWLFLFPETVTGMRHHWKHPAFDGEKAMAEEWLKEYAVKVARTYDAERGKDYAYERFMKDVLAGSIRFYGDDMCGPDDLPNADKLLRS